MEISQTTSQQKQRRAFYGTTKLQKESIKPKHRKKLITNFYVIIKIMHHDGCKPHD